LKIAISAEGPGLKAKVGERLGTSQYLILVDLVTTEVEAVPNPGSSGGSGAGMQVVALVLSKKVSAVLTGYCSPMAERYLLSHDVEVFTGVSGVVAEIVDEFKSGKLLDHPKVIQEPKSMGARVDKPTLFQALRSSYNQFTNLLPIMLGVVLLIGLFNAFVSREFLSLMFSGNKIQDTLLGACIGSIFAGNPINSYIIGGELLEYGVSLFAVTALIVAWVTVGLVQLPAEIVALGRRFALVRNAISFLLSIIIAIITVSVLDLIIG
jgi:predicted Fe-Mo cluster-binding NifX family protein